MHPRSHDILNYTKKTKGCFACTVFYVRDAPENNNLLTLSALEGATENKICSCLFLCCFFQLENEN